jgi:hypothetical protein
MWLNKKCKEDQAMNTKEPELGSEKTAGISTREPEPDQAASGAGTGQNNDNEKDTGQDSTGPHLVERMTALHGLSIVRGRITQSTIRKRTERDLRLPDAEVPYFKTEKAIRDLVCSLMERQDRMNESIFLKLNDLEYRLDDIEQRQNLVSPKQSGAHKGLKK